ncbi:3-oxo-5-alpha-steroid 4-dehydrogenase-domain-containing protein [Zopfochytrium polystomum]|nr:3-oxo-5-alpha-steroid 4-dehydrogenase-domain-containing protein [Zopfochytrium polystomum]
MKVVLKDRKGKVLAAGVDLGQGISPADATVQDLSRAIFKAFPKWNPSRQRLTTAPSSSSSSSSTDAVVLAPGKRLAEYNIRDGDTVIFKDLGPQVGWTTVFLIEYLGPLLIHPLLFFGTSWIYGRDERKTVVQIVTFCMVMVHFLKREYETIFIHRFSNDTMPLRNLPKNCFHYWVLSGALMGYFVYQPGFTGGVVGSIHLDALPFIVGMFVYAEVSNLITHMILSDLRPPGSKVRNIPFGYGFTYVTCPNYFYECMAWLCVAIVNGSLATYFFFVVSFVQMYIWALKKHKRYLKEFGDKYPKNRKVMVPFLL